MEMTFSSSSVFFLKFLCVVFSLSLSISLSIRIERERERGSEEMCVRMGGLVWNEQQKGKLKGEEKGFFFGELKWFAKINSHSLLQI